MQDTIRQAVQAALAAEGVANNLAFVVEHPNDRNYGDYTTNAALVAAKQLEATPREVAERLVARLEGKLPQVAILTIAGPGFINLTLTREYLLSQIQHAVSQGSLWGGNQSEADKEILLEYTSPNLFKPLHIGNLVGNIVGESLARLYTYAGATVHRINYPSDIGLTVAKGVWGLQQSDADPNDITAIGEAYRRGNDAYEQDDAAKAAIENINRALYAGTDDVINQLRAAGIATSERHLASICRQLGTEFGTTIYESEASASGKKVVTENIGKVFTESEGAVVFSGERVGLHTRVFLNSQGLPTYEAKDVGNFLLKQKQYPDWSQSIVVTGGEQREYFKVLYAAIYELYPEIPKSSLEHIPTGFLTLTTGKMSSRKGKVLTGESLLVELAAAASERASVAAAEYPAELAEAVGVAALKYQILRSGLGTDIVFDKERALSFEGDSGPYLQYTHARINSVLERAQQEGVQADAAALPAMVYELERVVYQFPEVVLQALEERAPHRLVGFLTELASEFNTFYAHESIADKADPHAAYKVLVTQAVQQTLRNGIWLLGMQAPERM